MKNKIFVTCLGFVILVSILIGLFTRSLLISSLTSELQKRGIGIAQGVADGARGYILTKNRAELTALAYDAKMGNRKDFVKYLVISDEQGRILAHTFTPGIPSEIRNVAMASLMTQAEVSRINVNGSQVFHVTVPVEEGIYKVGSVQIGLDKQHMDKLIAKLRWLFFGFISTVTVLFFFLSHRLALQITKPVSSLIRYTDQLTRGNFNILPDTIPSGNLLETDSGDDEISKLTNSFIRMTSQLKTSTEHLTESQEKYRSLFKSGPNPIFVVNKQTFEILDANPNAANLFEYSKEELVGMNLSRLAGSEDQQLPLTQAEGGRMVSRSKVRCIKKSGKSIFVNVHASPFEYRNREELIVAATDITELVEKDSQLIQASKMNNLEKMSAGIAHEINQPLNAIKIGSEYLKMMQDKKMPLDENGLYTVTEEISSQVTRAAEIVSRLKSFSRKADFSREATDINSCIRSVRNIIGRQIKLQNIDLVLDLDEQVPYILAHHNRMEQVIFNLVTNARDAINEKVESVAGFEKGEIIIATFFDGDKVHVTLSDNGTGIDPDLKERIFESFYTTKEMGEGLGLGLPIIHGIVKDYNGTIHVDSIPGEGTSFKLIFPAHDKTSGDKSS